MKFARPDVHIIEELEPIDRNDPAGAASAIEYSLPTDFSWRAKAAWKYFEGSAFLFEYKGKLVITDESLYLTEHGNGTPEAPFGFPRAVLDSWDEVEEWLDGIWDELAADGVL